jgi:hypothetical protein
VEGFEDIESADRQQRHMGEQIFTPYGDGRTHDARDDHSVNEKRLERRNAENPLDAARQQVLTGADEKGVNGARQPINEAFEAALRSNTLAPKTMEHLETLDFLAEPTPIVTRRIVSKGEDEIEV